MSLELLNTDRELSDFVRPGNQPDKLGNLLVKKGVLDPGDLLKALTLQQYEALRIGEILCGLGFTNADVVMHTLAEQFDLPIIDLEKTPPQSYLQDLLPAVTGLKLGAILWKKSGETLIVAIHDPQTRDQVTTALKDVCEDVSFVMAPQRQIDAAYRHLRVEELSRSANLSYPDTTSIRNWKGRKPAVIGLVGASLALSLIAVFPNESVVAALSWTMFVLFANCSFKLACLFGFLQRRAAQKSEVQALKRPKRLPKVSILVPVLRESEVLKQLIHRMRALKYPKELLEICLVYEANDTESRDHIRATVLPRWMRAIEVPDSTIQTKPRAMNYALDFVSGDIVGIFDAEDAPEPNQIYQVLSRFEDGGETPPVFNAAWTFSTAAQTGYPGVSQSNILSCSELSYPVWNDWAYRFHLAERPSTFAGIFSRNWDVGMPIM